MFLELAVSYMWHYVVALQVPRTGSKIYVALCCTLQVPRTDSKIYVALCCSTTRS